MPELPRKFSDWPTDAGVQTPAEIVRMYEAGYAGAVDNPEAKERLRAWVKQEGGWVFGSDATHSFGIQGSGKGVLSTPFLAIEKLYKGALPGPAQERGSCVAHGTKNACLLTLCCEVVAAKPDEVSGKTEGAPEVSPEGIRNGVLSTEAIYWWRRHGGDGWDCGSAAEVVLKESGVWVRKNYSELGFDLTDYSGSLEGKYGSRTPPDEVLKAGQQHLIRTATECSTFEEISDLIANGYGVNSCGGEGFSSSRDENGVSKRQGGWSHSMAYLATDDRPEIHKLYGGPLVLVQNSWAVFNSGPRRILGTNIDIFEGSFWARWSDIKNRYAVAFSGLNGWPRRQLPNWNLMAWG